MTDYPYKCVKCGTDAFVDVKGEYYCKACYDKLRALARYVSDYNESRRTA